MPRSSSFHLRVDRLTSSRGPATKPLFEDVSFTLAGERAGLVGPNGSGKSTLLLLLAARLRPDEGRVLRAPGLSVVYVPQEVGVAEAGPGSPGERRRTALLRALDAEPDVLLLDEPGNHLDASARRELMGLLQRFSGTLVIASHDRELLDRVTSRTLRISPGRATVESLPLPYGEARAQWELEQLHRDDLREAQVQKARSAARLLAAARDNHASAEKSRRTSLRMKGPRDHDSRGMGAKVVAGWGEATAGRAVAVAKASLARELAKVPDYVEDEPPVGRLFQAFERAKGSRLFAFVRDEVAREGSSEPWLRDVRVTVERETRVRIAGANGAGKTTLLRALVTHARSLSKDLPHVDLTQEPDVATVTGILEELRSLPPERKGRLFSILAALGTCPDVLVRSLRPSPGEAKKLVLARGLERGAHVLFLDEPEGHLDLPSLERLEDALEAYPGAIVLVTHDERLAARLTRETWTVKERSVFV